MSLQLIPIEAPGFNVISIKLLFLILSFCGSVWKSDDRTALQMNETEKLCLLKILISESYRPGLRGPSSPTIVPHKNLALYSNELGSVDASTDEFDIGDRVTLEPPLADKEAVTEEA